MDIAEEMQKPEVAVTVGAVGGLLAATVVPAALILAIGAFTAAGIYLYNWKFGDPEQPAQPDQPAQPEQPTQPEQPNAGGGAGETIDVTSETKEERK